MGTVTLPQVGKEPGLEEESPAFAATVEELPQAGAEEASVAPEAAASKEPKKERTPREDWATLLRRTFGFDVFTWC